MKVAEGAPSAVNGSVTTCCRKNEGMKALQGLFYLEGLAEKGGTGTAGDAYHDTLADMMTGFVEDYHLVLLSTTAKLLTAALAETFHKDFKLLAFILLVALGGNLRLQGDEFIDPGLLRPQLWMTLEVGVATADLVVGYHLSARVGDAV